MAPTASSNDLPWLLGFVLFGATGLHPSMAELTSPWSNPAPDSAGGGSPSSPGPP